MKYSIIYTYCLVFSCLFLIGCNGIRLLPKGDTFYGGAEINLESFDKIEKKKLQLIKSNAESALRLQPNKHFAGMRPKVWRYLIAGDTPISKFNKWLKNTGEAPVLLSSVNPMVTADIITAKNFNNGIFTSTTTYHIIKKKHTAKIIYTSKINSPYTIKKIVYAIMDKPFLNLILSANDESLIIPDQIYNLDNLKNERIRIDEFAKNNGYFYFNADYLIFKADTSTGNHTIAFTLMLKDSIPKHALIVYRIRNIDVVQNFSLDKIHHDNNNDTVMKIRSQVILRSIFFKKNELYSRQNHNITLNRLMSMGCFKFVSIKLTASDTSVSGFLDVSILMTPLSKRTIRVETDIVSKSNNNMGPRMNLSYLDRNTFNGAELLTINIASSYEAQFSGKKNNLYSYSFNPAVDLYFPDFLIPFKIFKTNSKYVPKTRFSLSYDYLKRVNYFAMSGFQFIYGFKWKQDIRREHELNPINISYTSITNTSATFTELLASNPFLKKSYEEKFIAGSNYVFTYNEQVQSSKTMQYFFRLNTELAGNILSLSKLIIGKDISAVTPLKIVGSPYSQFTKISIDGRCYYNFISKNKIALRVFAGFGKAFGNSSVLPYTKQYFSGGPTSIRAFHINSVGPGTIYQDNSTKRFLQTGGDIKLETNAEYRFALYRYLKGALFIDAGNIWALKSNATGNNNTFSFSKFYNQLAVGTGIGLRLDVSFFILRFDLAMPIRKPWLEDNQRWVFDKINFRNTAWRNENLILNIAIGYPF